MRKERLLALFCFILAFGCFYPLQADISGAHSTVVAAIDSIYADIASEFESEDELKISVEQSLNRHLSPVLDFEKFTKLILAAHWKKATVVQRQRFSEILKGFLYQSLTKAIVDHRHILVSRKESISVMDAVPGRNEDRAMVSVVVESPSSGNVKIDFRMGRKSENWLAYDVIVQDISFAINYRAILNSEIRQNGIDNVIESFATKLKFELP